jgi:glutaredoxin 3
VPVRLARAPDAGSDGFDIDEHVLSSREEVDAFEAEQRVRTTPQVFIAGERIGGSDDLERYLVKNPG